MLFLKGCIYRRVLTICVQGGIALIIGQIINYGTAYSQQASVQQHDSLWTKTGSSRIENHYDDRGILTTVITNYSFLITVSGLRDLVPSSSMDHSIIIAQEERIEHRVGTPLNPTVKAEAFLLYKGKLEKRLWGITEKAHSGNLMGINGTGSDYYHTYKIRGGGLLPLHGLYKLSTGKKLFYYVKDVLSVSKPNTGHRARLIAFNNFMPDNDQSLGALYYTSSDSVLHELRFYEKKPGTFTYFSPFLEFSDIVNSVNKIVNEKWLDLVSGNFSNDPKDFTGFSIKLRGHDFELKIPVKNDDFDLSNFTSDVIRIERKK